MEIYLDQPQLHLANMYLVYINSSSSSISTWSFMALWIVDFQENFSAH